jgi:hypothetical protein
MALETDGSTPDVALERLSVVPWKRTPAEDNEELTQVVTDASMTVMPDARRRKFATVTPGIELTAAAVLLGIVLGEYGLAETRGTGPWASATGTNSGPPPTSVQPVPTVQWRRPVQSVPSQ